MGLEGEETVGEVSVIVGPADVGPVTMGPADVVVGQVG